MAWSSWKTLTLLAIAAWGLWGFLGKIALERIGWGPAFALLALSDTIVLLLIKPKSFLLQFNGNYLLGLGMALAGTLGGICFYMALESGPATAVIPGTALYIVVAAVLAFVFLGEAITLNRIMGIGLGLAAIYFLSKG
jgi:bacterial/archaeal transporter family protein